MPTTGSGRLKSAMVVSDRVDDLGDLVVDVATLVERLLGPGAGIFAAVIFIGHFVGGGTGEGVAAAFGGYRIDFLSDASGKPVGSLVRQYDGWAHNVENFWRFRCRSWLGWIDTAGHCTVCADGRFYGS